MFAGRIYKFCDKHSCFCCHHNRGAYQADAFIVSASVGYAWGNAGARTGGGNGSGAPDTLLLLVVLVP
jgi:hypothetical protein